MPRSVTQLEAGKRGLNMNFDHEELMLMMLYNTGTRLGLIHELRLMQCYLMPDETALRTSNLHGCSLARPRTALPSTSISWTTRR